MRVWFVAAARRAICCERAAGVAFLQSVQTGDDPFVSLAVGRLIEGWGE